MAPRSEHQAIRRRPENLGFALKVRGTAAPMYMVAVSNKVHAGLHPVSDGFNRGDLHIHLLVQLWSLAGNGREVRCNACLYKQPVDLVDLFAISGHVVEEGGKIEAERSVELALNHSWRDDSSAKVDGFIW